jgi:exopolyphosphatase/guanosine-5'-triphosphate,3'-diphosphate pyrophosphatase
MTLRLTIGPEAIHATHASGDRRLPVGIDTLRRGELRSDPPRPEELTNAIGLVVDHLDDLVRELPLVIGAEVVVIGPELRALAAVEVGAEPVLPLALGRDAVEDVFRTVVTEALVDRRLNPGLPHELAESIVAGCCIAVAVMRRLQLAQIVVEDAA